jgi:hypothetical protein
MIERAASGKSSSQRPGRRFYYWSALAVLFAWAAWQRFSLPLDPIADPDTWGYLSPALRKLLGGEFGHTAGRNFVYPAFLFSILRVFADFRAIVIIQHLLGLGAGGLLILTWQRARISLPDMRLSRAAHDVLGLLAATVFLWAAEPIRAEMQLRPEAVCSFLVSLNLYLAFQFIACFFLERRRRATVVYGIATAFTSVALVSAKPSFGLAAILALVPIGIFFFRRGWLAQRVALGAGAALSAALFLVPEHFLSRNDEASRTFLPTALFVVHADLIRDQLADDLQRGSELPYSRERLARVLEALKTEIPKSFAARPGHYWSLGFDPDYLMYDKTSIDAQLRQEFDQNVAELCAFYRFAYWRIWQGRPLLVLKKIKIQMSIFYSEMCPAFNREKSLAVASGYADGATVLEMEPYPKLWSAYPAAVEFMSRTELLGRRTLAIRQTFPLRMTLSFLSGVYRPLLWVAVALSVLILCGQRYRSRLGWLAALVLFLYSYNAAACLEVAVLNSLEVRRYLTVQVFFVIGAELFALWLLCETALEMRERRKVIAPVGA